MRARVAAALITVAMVPWAAAVPASATTVFGLEVSAEGWALLLPEGHLQFSRDLFEVAGDLDGDSFSDLILKGNTNWYAAWGSAGGLSPNASQENIAGWLCMIEPWYCSVSTSGAGGPAADLKPTGVDMDGHAGAEWLIVEHTECAPSPPYSPCTNVTNEVAWGNGTRERGKLAGVPFGPQPSAYLLPGGPVGPDALLLVERVFGRDRDAGTPARTELTVRALAGGNATGANTTWTVDEPTPYTDPPRPPRFLAAPDFNLDGYADLVLWSPPGQGQNGPVSGMVTVFNGSSSGFELQTAVKFPAQGFAPLIGDFDGDGHPDIATYQPTNIASNGQPGTAHVDITAYLWTAGNSPFGYREVASLEGPSIFLSQPPVRMQAGDIDGDGVDDLVAVKYDTTSSATGHLLVDVFLGPKVCRACDMVAQPKPDYSTAIEISGSDIYAGDGGVRVNLQGDFDNDARRDLVVGYYGSNAPRAPTSNSSFVALLAGKEVVRTHAHIGIDADPGRAVYPMYRNYTVSADPDGVGDGADLDLEFRPFTPPIPLATLHINAATKEVTSSDESKLVPAGPATLESVVCIVAPCPGTFSVSFRFNWSFSSDVWFTLALRRANVSGTDLAWTPSAGRLFPQTTILGDLSAESEGRAISSGGWVRGGALVNFTSTLSVVFAGATDIHPIEPVTWRLSNSTGNIVQAGSLTVGVTAPGATNRDWTSFADFTGLPEQAGHPRHAFAVLVDGDTPTYGDHLPLSSEWMSSLPVFAAVQVFDTESGVDPDRIEYSWENDGAPFVRWSKADYEPGQTAAEVVATAYLNLPEGNLSNVIWRAWDRVGNGPKESPIFGVKVDTQDLRFHDAAPQADEWVANASSQPSIWITAGASGVDATAVEYRFSSSGLFGFGNWTPFCDRSAPPPGRGCAVMTMRNPDGSLNQTMGTQFWTWDPVAFAQGDQNWIQWRAANNATHVPKASEPYQIRFDTRPLGLSLLPPDDSPVQPQGPIRIEVYSHEGSAPTVAQRGVNASEGAATFRIRGPGATEFGSVQPLKLVNASGDGWSANFTAELTLERGNSTVQVSVGENSYTSRFGSLPPTVAEVTIRINQLPLLVVSSVPNNLTVEQNATITLTANATDPEGAPLRYLWGPCTPPPRGPPRPFGTNDTLVLGATSIRGTPSTNKTGDITLCLTVSDDLDGVVRQTVVVHVVPEGSIPPPPDTSDPTTVIRPDYGALVLVLLLLAAVGLAAYLLARRRLRAPPDNL